MHCRSCELLIEQNLSNVSGVKKTEASFKKGSVAIYFEGAVLEENVIVDAIKRAGYTIGSGKTLPWFSRNSKDYFDVVVGGVVLFVLYLTAKIFGIETFTPNFGDAPAYPIVILIGLTAGISTCMALVGGLVLGISARHAESHPEASRSEKFKPHLFFNSGRIVAFTLLGGVVGFAGSIFQISSSVLGWLVVVVGFVMLFLGLQLLEIFPRFSATSFSLSPKIGRWFGLNKKVEGYSHTGSTIAGALTFFLPCGFTQAMQVYAISTGSFTRGTLIMGLFALGTTPGLLGIGGLTSFVKGTFGKMFFKFVGLVVVLFALINLSSGMTLSGFQLPNILPSKIESPNVSKKRLPPIENGFQVIQMKQMRNGYEPNQFTIRKGIPVRWEIDGTTPYSCSNTVVIPALRIGARLVVGPNIVEFTAPKVGHLSFSCAMGMYTGYFDVIE